MMDENTYRRTDTNVGKDKNVYLVAGVSGVYKIFPRT
jgi:hypothetical protein